MSCRYKFLLALFLFLQSSQSFALPAIQLKKVAEGFKKPVYAVAAKDGSGRLFVVEQRGMIYVLDPSLKSRKTFLDIRKKVDIGVEKGLLSIVFHPQFKNNGRVFIDYTGRPAKVFSFISEFKVAPNADKIDPATEKVLIKIEQPSPIHKGGTLLFGPDGFLYISSGDGGPRLDPHNRGQSLNTLLGKILRIDVDRIDPEYPDKKYAIPPDNPFVGQKNAAPEIFAYGLRNPWRFSIDPVTGFIFAGDVGQEAREEIDFIEKGKNYGWRVMEGNICTPEIKQKCEPNGLMPPILDYGRDVGMSVIGGLVYRGKEFPSLQGIYFYADFVLGKIWGLRYDGKQILEHQLLLDTDFPISSFGEGEQGELYVVDYTGNIYQIIQ